MADESRIVKDPICGKEVDTLRARAVGIFGGVTYYFCSAECKAQYKDPRKTPRRDATKDTPLPPHAPPPPDSGKVLAPPLKLVGPSGAAGGAERSGKVDVRSGETREPSRDPAPALPDEAKKAEARKPEGKNGGERKKAGEAKKARPALTSVPPAGEGAAPRAAARLSDDDEAPLTPPRSRAPLVSFLIVMLILAGGVLLFTLKHK